MNIEHVKLAFSLGRREKSTGAFQRFIIAHNESSLLDIPTNEYPDKNGMSGILIGAHNHIEATRVRRMEENAILKHVARNVGPDHFVWQIVSADKFRRLYSRIRSPNDHYALRVVFFDYWYRLFITGQSLAS